ESSFWVEGQHEGQHSAGEDLTPMLALAPHGDEVFAKMPVVGTLEDALPSEPPGAGKKPHAVRSEAPEASSYKTGLQILYKKYHPHPMAVHFPIALHLFAAGLDIVFLVSPKAAYADGVFYTFFVATVMGFVAMVPGVLSWWINYNLSKSRPFVVKLIVATLTLLLGVLNIALYLEDPGIVYEASFEGIIYHSIVLLTGLSVIVLGYYGGKITWGDLSEYEEHNTKAAAAETPESHAPKRGKLQAPRGYEVPFSSAATMAPVNAVRHQDKSAAAGKSKSIAILIGGAAGTGIDTLEKILSDAFKRSGYYLFSTKEYMSRVRGGSNTALIRISDTPVAAPCWEVDLFIAIDELALAHAKARCSPASVILADQSFANKDAAVTAIPMNVTAQKLGNIRYANTYAAGVIFGLLGIDEQYLLQSVAERFEKDTANEEAVKAGFEAGTKIEHSRLPVLPEADRTAVERLHLMDGTTAAGFGFLAGGCNMITAYPMSPSTGVLNFMAAMSKQFDIAVEQSEDEIASLTMVLGGWYAGARAMTTTSGGGFALMGEALSLSGMTETPAVIYLAQRPGPATGLPTRSEQGDLNMALYSGHGPFSRVILAPGSLQECIDCGYLAFELADRYQIPVIVLSDQYLADSMTMIGDVDFSSYEQRRYVVKSTKEYGRYTDTDSGISPRAVPGFGEGLICAAGDEHDERGQITEDYGRRVQMVSKRARKNDGLIKEAVPPLCEGD
ncbi:2-oxoacid:acceptor oxidoreductase subunit alpha, partial [bacterium]|nr:2-oxoacid:acceptor oxidoreductase subunit alpha [bacterium]